MKIEQNISIPTSKALEWSPAGGFGSEIQINRTRDNRFLTVHGSSAEQIFSILNREQTSGWDNQDNPKWFVILQTRKGQGVEISKQD